MSLFFQVNIDDFMFKITSAIAKEIEGIPEADLMADANAICQSFVDRYPLDVPELVGEAEADAYPNTADARQPTLSARIDFKGDPRIFQVRGRYSPMLTVPCRIEGSSLVFEIEAHMDYPERVAQEIESFLGQVRKELDTLRDEFGRYAGRIPSTAMQHLRSRRTQIEKRNKFHGKLSAIIPLRKRDDGTDRIVVPVQRTPAPLPVAVHTTVEEPEIAMAAYDDILKTMQSMVKVFERSPSVFKEMGEESLRTILLVGLNGLYEGAATGETFNGTGKNDILIRHRDQNVFIAECLIWEGVTTLQSKMDDQLFKYATWRDSKLALLIFNRNKNFTDVIDKMKSTVAGHSHCIRQLPFMHESGARYLFKRSDDPQKQFTLTCLAFDVPR